MTVPMATQSEVTAQAKQTRPTATPRALRPTCHTAATKVWTARNWGGIYQRVSDTKTSGEETHDGVQGDPEYTNLPDKDLCCAILPCRDGSVMNPPDIKDATHCMQKVKHEKRELSCKFNEPSE